MKINRKAAILSLAIFALFTALAGVAIGPVHISLGKSAVALLDWIGFEFDIKDTYRTIITQIRLPRVLVGGLVGASLAISGAVMQGLFRNPLASPYVLGVASGASAGAALIIVLDLVTTFTLPAGAFLGGIVATAAVYKFSTKSIYTLILAGIALSALFSAITTLLISIASPYQRDEIIFWVMGGLWRSNWAYFYVLLPITLIGSLIIMLFGRDLNVMALGEDMATHLGIRPQTIKKVLLGAATLVTSTAVAVAGTIGFVGLITPHALRLIIGPDHRFLLPAAALGGAVFLMWTDIAAKTITRPAEFPVGMITAFFGAPFFLYLLRKRRR